MRFGWLITAQPEVVDLASAHYRIIRGTSGGKFIEWEGMSGTMRGHSYSLPSAQGLQYGVQGVAGSVSGSSPQWNLVELKEILKGQQKQLDKLTQSLAVLRGTRYPRSPWQNSSVICHRRQHPGSFARECDGKRVLSTAFLSQSVFWC